MTVWVVIYFDMDFEGIVGVYSSEIRAEFAAEEYSEHNPGYATMISEFSIDE